MRYKEEHSLLSGLKKRTRQMSILTYQRLTLRFVTTRLQRLFEVEQAAARAAEEEAALGSADEALYSSPFLREYLEKMVDGDCGC